MPTDPSAPEVPSEAATGSYVVVARRYRPRSFHDLVGQQQISQALRNAIATNRVGHAYLFTGARGVGKTSTARIFAKALNAPEGPTAEPDNSSDICQAIDAGEDVDVLEIDGASNRGIDEIRQLRSNANVRPSRARYKIYIIDEVHMLTTAAFNALLKTLEEPPPHVKFIFCTTDPQKIPITVLSRCQRYDFAPVDVPSIVERLTEIVAGEQREAEPEVLQLLARRAEGSMRDSQSLLEQLMAYASGPITLADAHQMLGTAASGQLIGLIDALVKRDAAEALRLVDQAAAGGVDCGQLTEQLLGHFRDMMAIHVGCGAESLRYANPSDVELLGQSSQQLGLETTLAGFEVLDRAISRMRQSTQPRMLLEIAVVRICNLENLDQLSTLIAQLQSGQSICAGTTAAGSRPSPAPSTTPAQKAPPAKKSPQKKNPAVVAEASVAASAPPPAPSLSPDSADRIWKQALEQLGDMTADFASYYDHVAISAPDSLVVHFPARYTLQKESCEQPDRKAQLERTLAGLTGRKIRIDLAIIPEEKPQHPAPPQRSIFQLMREKEGDPFVRHAVELFDAEIVKVDVPRGGRRDAGQPDSATESPRKG